MSENKISRSELANKAIEDAKGSSKLHHLEFMCIKPDCTVELVSWINRRSIGKMPAETIVSCDGWLDECFRDEAMAKLCPKGKTIYGQRRADEGDEKQRGRRVKTGGYRPLFGKTMATDFRIVRFSYPKLKRGDKAELLVQAMAELVDHPKVGLAFADPDGLVLVQSADGWLGPWLDKGMQVMPVPTAAKRMTTMTRTYAFGQTFATSEIRIRVITEKEMPKALGDGCCVIRRSVIVQVIDSLDVSCFDDEMADSIEDLMKESGLDEERVIECLLQRAQDRVEKQKQRAMQCSLFNFRGLIPKGTPAVPKGGLLKGNCIAVDDETFDHLYGKDVDIVTHEANVKPELYGWESWTLAIEPQPALAHVRSNVQAMINFPQLMPPDAVKEWATQEVYRVCSTIMQNKLLDTFETLASRRLHGDKEVVDIDSHLLWSAWKALDFFAAGYDFRHAPALVEKIYASHTKTMLHRNRNGAGVVDKVQVPVPCAVEEQIVCQSMANLAGVEIQVAKGTIRRCPQYGFSIVHDEDWVAMLPDHGGCDQDDHFMLFFRTDLGSGKRVVVTMRNPSDIGEYSVFQFVQGDPYPKFIQRRFVNGGKFLEQEVEFPTVDFTGAPKMTSESLADGSLTIRGLPHDKKVPQPTKEYTKASAIVDLRRVLNGTSPGQYVNAKMVANNVLGKQMPSILATMEDVVDTCTKGGDVAAMQAIRAESLGILESVVAAGVPVDRTLWAAKGNQYLDPQPQLVDGWLTELVAHVEDIVARGAKRIAAWAQEIATVPSPLTEYRNPRYKVMVQILKVYRKRSHDMMEAEKAGKPQDWKAFRQGLLKDVRPENVGTFALVVHEVKTTRDEKVADGLLWGKEVLPYYFNALGIE